MVAMLRSNGSGKAADAPRRLRCAIYTRKSTEEGLEQDFNSLDAQREAAQAFIQSQRREGWVGLPEPYDDGGFTGANMDRPALQRLLAAVEAGELDCVVVYKVDRLSRSLLDFTRILSLFEKHQVSFVAVTQQFNTSTSLGRLTLNILLSFAQFERELIGERTRDKMSAARRKGKWVGGCPVLGYDVVPGGGGRLVVNAEEAERVRAIFALFAEYGSAWRTLEEIEQRGWRLKSWTRPTGQVHVGGSFTRTGLRRLLTNSLYTGVVRHQGQAYPGEHQAIVDPEAWERVQTLIRHRTVWARGPLRNKHQGLLSGLLYCTSCGTPMVYSYAASNGRKYPYYVCLNAQRKGWAVCPTKSLPVRAIEESVLVRVRGAQYEILCAGEWETMDRSRQIEVIQGIVERVGYDGATQQISIRFHERAIPVGGQETRA
jgi:site-specific DNA recombinase